MQPYMGFHELLKVRARVRFGIVREYLLCKNRVKIKFWSKPYRQVPKNDYTCTMYMYSVQNPQNHLKKKKKQRKDIFTMSLFAHRTYV